MSTLTQSDGTEFVMQAYREQLIAKKKSLISQRVRLLAEQHGQFVRLLKKRHDEYEAIFSRESGFLLGETIKYYFGQVQNLIFCEALPNSSDVLLVVIRGGNVHLDATIPSKNIRSELMPLLTAQQTYQVVISGTVPLTQKSHENGFVLPAECVHSFEALNAPLFPRLPAIRGLQLLTLPAALKAERLNNQNMPLLAMILAGCCVLGLAYWSFSPKEKTIAIPSMTTEAADTFQVYNQALMTPSPRKQLAELRQLIQQLYGLPGWEALKITFKNHQYQVTVHSLGGDLEILNQWAATQGFNFQLAPNAAQLILSSHTLARVRPENIYNAALVLTALIDQLDEALGGKHITLEESKNHGNITEIPFSINLSNASPQTLILVGDTLLHLPVSINHIELTLQLGTVSGVINLSVWGK